MKTISKRDLIIYNCVSAIGLFADKLRGRPILNNKAFTESIGYLLGKYLREK